MGFHYKVINITYFLKNENDDMQSLNFGLLIELRDTAFKKSTFIRE